MVLFNVPPAVAADGPASGEPSDAAADAAPETPSGFTPGAPPGACRDCGLRYYPPATTPSEAAPAAPSQRATSKNQPKGTSGGAARLERKSSSGLSHLSSDPRVTTARALVQRNRFAEALKILRRLPPDHPDQTDVRFLLGLAASRGSQERGITDEQRLALLDEAIAVFRSILIRQPELVRVRLELALPST